MSSCCGAIDERTIVKLTDENDFAQPALASSGPVWTAAPPSHAESSQATWKYARRFQAQDAPLSITSPSTLLAEADSASTYRSAVEDAVDPNSITHVRALRQEAHVASSVIKYASSAHHEGSRKTKGEHMPLVVMPFINVPNRFDLTRPVSKCLVFRAGGLYGNQLIVGNLHPSDPHRDGGAPAFADYDAYEQNLSENRQKLTRSVLERQAAERAARLREGKGAKRPEVSTLVHMTTSERVLHQFPSPICSLHVAPGAGELLEEHRSHSKNWICIRTVTSTIFASVRVQRRALWSAKNLAFVELCGLLEIMHGESTISSGVKGHRLSRNRKWTDISVLSSPCRIVDVAFHPVQREAALTIDAAGSLGRFECDFFNVLDRGWRHSSTWSLSLANPPSPGRQLDDAWTVDWSSGGETCLVAHSEGVWDVRLTDGARKVVYEPFGEAEVVSISTGTDPSPLLWIATTEEVLALDLRAEHAFERLASCAHSRHGGEDLHIEAISQYPARNVALLSSFNDALVSTFALQVDRGAPIATWDGEPSILQTGALQPASRRSSFPLLLNVSEMDEDWRRALQDSVDPDLACATFAILETTSEGGLWITGACAVQKALSDLPFDSRTEHATTTIDGHGRVLQSNTNALTLRTVHSLGGMYKYLYSSVPDGGAYGQMEQKVPQLLLSASRWMEQQGLAHSSESPAIMLAHDVLAARAGKPSGSARLGFQPASHDEGDDENMKELWSAKYAHILRERTGDYDEQEEKSGQELLLASLEVTERFSVNPSGLENADQQARLDAVNANLASAAQEMMFDMALSTCPLSKETREHGDEQRETLNGERPSCLVPSPLFIPGGPHPSKPKEPGRKIPLRMPVTDAARSLLEEWPLGVDPTEYQYGGNETAAEEEDPFSNGVWTGGAAASKRSSQRSEKRSMHHRGVRSGIQTPLASDDVDMPPPLVVQSRHPPSDDRAYESQGSARAAAFSDLLQPQSRNDSLALDPTLRDVAWQSQSNGASLASQVTAVQPSQPATQKVRKKRRVGGF